MGRTRIKICGVTRPQDALAAAELGADAVGFVRHAPAGRCAAPEAARAIVASLPPFVTPVAVYAGEPAPAILADLDAIGPGVAVQLQRAATPDMVAALAARAVIAAVHVDRATAEAQLSTWQAAAPRLPNLRGLLLETAGVLGGSGVENDWELIASLRQRFAGRAGMPPLIVAGGLTPENVGRVVREIRPWAVDVATGVEEAKGIKSAEKIAEFVAAVRAADAADAAAV